MSDSEQPKTPAGETPAGETPEEWETPDFSDREDPFVLFADWFAAAKETEPADPDAMALASVDGFGLPNLRMVLLKGVDEGGFVFYTNFESVKGAELLANPKAAACFHWKSLRRQVRIRGAVEKVADAEADAYFTTRPRASRIGAWASDQSRALESRFALEKRIAKFAARYAVGPVPRPPHWSGFRIVPVEIEFWHERAFRLHDRIRFARAGGDAPWGRERLYP